ncbi:MAG: heavy metal translocating P-type ATPase [Isosphaeraceae bacterium]
MHREYHPEDLRPAGGPDHHRDRGRPGHDHRPLYALTIALGLLLAAELVAGLPGLQAFRRPLGVSWAWIAAVIGGARIVYGAVEALARGRIGADFALAQACVAALVLGEPFVAAEVVFIAMVGEALEAIVAERAFRNIGRLFDRAPATATVRRDGAEQSIPAADVRIGEVVIVGAGERLPVDGTVLSGRSTIDPSSLTGESLPIDAAPGDRVLAGTINQFGRLEVVAERVGGDTTIGQVLRLVAEAQLRKAPIHRTADRLAGYFLPAVEAAAILTLVAGYLLGWADPWSRAVAILVVACPCALVLATPAAVLAGLAWMARHGVIARGGEAIERLAGCDTFAFDKTGTLTFGQPELAGVRPLSEGFGEGDILRLAAAAEASSRHPLAALVREAAAGRALERVEARDIEALPGAGVAGVVDWQGKESTILVGNRRLMSERGLTIVEEVDRALEELDGRGETALLVAIDGRVVGLIGASDRVRPEARGVVRDLGRLRIGEIAILTGDRPGAATRVGKGLNLPEVHAELLPADKAGWIRDRQREGRRVAMVGDGINDAPALAEASAGLAIAGPGADLAAEAGDFVLMGDPLRVLPDLVKLSRATVGIIRQNILVFAFGLNALAMAAAALGWLAPVPAAILHQAGSLLVLLNAMRLLAFGNWADLPPFPAIRRSIGRLDEALDPGPVVDALASWRRPLLAAAGLLLVGYGLASNVHAIAPGEVGLVVRGGRLVATLGPGLHARWPRPIESVRRVEPARVEGLEIGFRSVSSAAAGWQSGHDRAATAIEEDEALLMTGDGQLVELTASAQYRIDPERLARYAFGSADPKGALRSMAEAAIRATVARSRLDDLLASGRSGAEESALHDLRKRVQGCDLGLSVVSIAFQDVHPPLPVLSAFREVSQAEGERRTRINQAGAILAERLASAKGLAAAARARAEADRDSAIARAGGEAAAFLDARQGRAGGPSLADWRLYQDAIAGALEGRSKVILDPARAPGRRQLILPNAPPWIGSDGR